MIKNILLKLNLIKKAPVELEEKVWLDWRKRFEKYQELLLWIANHRLTRWVLGLHKLPIRRKIDRIDPASIQWKTGKKYLKIIKRKGIGPKKVLVEEWKGMFFTRQRFAEALQVNLFPIFFLLHIWDLLLGNRFEFLPNLGCDTVLYYVGGGDGWVGRDNVSSWADAHDTLDGNAVDYTYSGDSNEIHASLVSGSYYLRRHFMPIDTSGIPDGVTITAAKYYFYFINDGNNADNHSFRIVPANQASVTQLTTDDYDAIGTTAYSSDIPKSSLVGDQMNYITLNSAGIGAINKTGWTKLGMRSSLDINNIEPTGWNTLRTRNSEYTGTTYDPYLEVTYTTVRGRSYGYIF